jgi:acetyltransferase-like isoleucine patch superfamily enzyme
MPGRLLFFLYGVVSSEMIRRRLRMWILALEGGPGQSQTIRLILRKYYGVDVGLHSVVPCAAKPQVLHRGTIIGRYSILADTVRTYTRDHPMSEKSSHGLFYNSALGWSKAPPLVFGSLEIGHGVRIGHHAIILRPTRRIGDGAIVESGAVVYGDVPAFAVVEGNPAQVVRFRYSAEAIEEITASRWWDIAPRGN